MAVAQAAIASAPALHELANCPQMNCAITPIFNALPWLKSFWLTAWKLASVRPSRPTANSTAGEPQDPKSNAARRTFLAAAALHASSCALQSPTDVPASDPELAALEQAVFC